MYVYSTSSKKFHTDACSFGKKIKKANRILKCTVSEAIFDGCTPCLHCSGINKQPAFIFHKKEIIDFCRQNQISFDLYKGCIVLQDRWDKWIIMPSFNENKHLYLYHKNSSIRYDVSVNTPIEKLTNYHLQKDQKTSSILNNLKYIVKHRRVYEHRPNSIPYIMKQLQKQLNIVVCPNQSKQKSKRKINKLRRQLKSKENVIRVEMLIRKLKSSA